MSVQMRSGLLVLVAVATVLSLAFYSAEIGYRMDLGSRFRIDAKKFPPDGGGRGRFVLNDNTW